MFSNKLVGSSAKNRVKVIASPPTIPGKSERTGFLNAPVATA